MVGILMVEDNPAEAILLQNLLKAIAPSLQAHRAKDGLEALDYLAQQKIDPDGGMPDVILMDLNMPRVSGLEALRVIKSDPDLRGIPVVILSNSASQAEVDAVYQAHANCYLKKPDTLEQAQELVRLMHGFWCNLAVLPSHRANVSRPTVEKGIPVAQEKPEVEGHAMLVQEPVEKQERLTGIQGCQAHRRLMDEFAASAKELLALHEQQFQAIIDGDADCSRFDLLIHMANERKQQAKYAYLRHVESHGCANLNVLINASGT
jgi:CheY-like chemotaxis protein